MKKQFLTVATIALVSLFAASAHADFVRLLPNDQEALQARADLIQQAKKEIMVEYFIMTDDDLATSGLALLRQAAQRGVKVRIMIDGIFNSVKPETLEILTQDSKDSSGQQNLEIRLFKPANLLKPISYLHRDHTKMLNIDGQIMISGGRNVQKAYFGLDEKHNFKDLDILVSGKVAADAKDFYNQLWARTSDVRKPHLTTFTPEFLARPCPEDDPMGCDANKARHSQRLEAARNRFDQLLQTMNSGNGNIYLDTGHNWLSDVKNYNDVHFLADNPDKTVGENNQVVSDELFKVASQTEHSLLIMTPYLVPTARATQVFQDLLKKHVHITIVTNSLKSTDNLLAQAGYQQAKADLIASGIELYEFNLTDTLHAKTAVIDGHIVFVGSYNLDPRSSRINREIVVEVNDEENSALGAELTSIIESFKEKSLLVGKDGKVQNAELQNKGVSASKIRAVHLLELGLPLYRNQL